MSDAFVKVVLDSISPYDIRLPTLHLRYWRAIHSEFLTHRVFSRNGRSSRAVPVTTLLSEPIYVPHFMKNRPGMVATEELSIDAQLEAREIWLTMAQFCQEGVRRLQELGVHKQHANRPLEWFGYIDVLLTTTEIANFFALRDDKDAQPEIRDLAQMMKEALAKSTPRALRPGEWHLPWVTDEECQTYDLATLQKLSTVRNARISYKPFDGNADLEAELARYERLMVARPVHASPAEHLATPDTALGCTSDGPAWMNPRLHGNFTGWIQYRKTLPYEAVFDR